MTRNLRALAALAVPAALVFVAGCSSCKDYQTQIGQLDAQIAEMQNELAARDAKLRESESMAAEMERSLSQCRADNKVLVEQRDEVVMITVDDQLAYKSSQVVILDSMVPVLKAIAGTLNEHPDWDVFVEGYTDSRKIGAEFVERFPSNWELGAHRACAVVRYLTNELGLPAERFAAVSYGPFRPVADNGTEEGRAQNRQVRFVMHKRSR